MVEEYKVGDWVIITQKTSEQGIITQIIGPYLNGPKSRQYWKLSSCTHVYDRDQMRKALPHEIPEEDLSKVPYSEWQVGDTVERTAENSFYTELGMWYIITAFEAYKSLLQVEGGENKNWYAKNFKLVKRKEQINNNQNDSNENKSKESKGSDGTNPGRDRNERFDIQIGGCGNGLKTCDRERKIRSVEIGTGQRSKGQGLCPGRRIGRTVTI